ncbi:MAG: VOC family protein [Thermoplasmata archaeon]|jgi:lactoylglutathione lyase|nr:VOC family protein [Thermoplasmata archaeon]
MYVDYVGLRVTNLARSLRFFTQGLGLQELRRGKMFHGGVWVLLEDPISHQRIELNWYPRGSKYATPFVAGEGMDHLGIRVSNVALVARQLRAAGAKRVEEFRNGRTLEVAYYEGPDGLWVELIRSPTP